MLSARAIMPRIVKCFFMANAFSVFTMHKITNAVADNRLTKTYWITCSYNYSGRNMAFASSLMICLANAKREIRKSAARGYR
jgi:uncharacterized membrane protein YkvI